MYEKPKALIFGAGLAGRGFLAHLLKISGFNINFVDSEFSIVELMRKLGKYHIHVINNPDCDICLDHFSIFHISQNQEIINEIYDSELILTAIGGNNLPSLAPIFMRFVRDSMDSRLSITKNVLICENFYNPIQLLTEEIQSNLNVNERSYLNSIIGFGEGQILRSCMAHPEKNDPLALDVQNYWEFPVNFGSIKGDIPKIVGVREVNNLGNGLILKLYTYNSISASISYLGYQKGYKYLSEAANDPDISEIAEGVGDECIQALTSGLNIDLPIAKDSVNKAISKFKDASINDTIDRNTRDVIRKLSYHDRLIGPAVIALSNDIYPKELIKSIVAALNYKNINDQSSIELQNKIKQGIHSVLREICGLDPYSELSRLIIQDYHTTID